MTAYAWPGWRVSSFELRIQPNTRTFVGPYTPNVQVLDFMGERWVCKMSVVPSTDPLVGAAMEAFFDRLKGPANQIVLGHQKFSAPQGTMRGTPVLTASVAQLANTATLTTTAGATLRAGDMLGINGQLVRVMADATADGAGHMMIEFQPRARVAWTIGAVVTWNAPTANFMMKADSAPITWVPGYSDAITVELIEVP